MAEPVKTSRRYRSTLRTEQAEATRERIAATARDLFIQDGYATTTIRAVAARAGVAAMTVYTASGETSLHHGRACVPGSP